MSPEGNGKRANPRPHDEELRRILAESRSIAVVGIKSAEHEDAYRVPLYMQREGFRIIPVSPKQNWVLGEPAYPDLNSIPDEELPVDLINLFRASGHIPGHLEEILALEVRPKAVWMQLGIQHAASADRLRAQGITVIEDLCIMVEHRRLVGLD